MNFHMNDMEKTMAELYRMLKIVEDSIKKNLNHVKKNLMGPRALSIRQKTSLSLLLIRNASIVTRRDIDSGTVRSTWMSRRRREVRLPRQV
jgi:hypothetical protein